MYIPKLRQTSTCENLPAQNAPAAEAAAFVIQSSTVAYPYKITIQLIIKLLDSHSGKFRDLMTKIISFSLHNFMTNSQ